MPRTNVVKIARDEVGVSQQMPITHFHSPTVLESQNGSVFSVIQLSGVPFETEKIEMINQYSRTWHRALTALDERFAIWGTMHRRRVDAALPGQFSNAFAERFNRDYCAQFKERSFYVNDYYLAIIFKGLTSGKVGTLHHVWKSLSRRTVQAEREAQRDNHIKILQEAVSQLMTALSDFKPVLLGSDDQSLGYSALLSYLSLFVNAGEALRFKGMKDVPLFVNRFKEIKSKQSLYPEGHLSQYLTAKHIFFGDVIQFQGSTKNDTRFAAMVSVKRYGSESASVMLDPLLHLDAELIATNSFLIESKSSADQRMLRHTRKLENADDPAVSQIDALSEARDQLASDAMVMGFHHNTVMLLSDSKESLEKKVSDTIKCYMEAGFVAVRETLGQEAAFWSQVPTHFKMIARSSLISSNNFVDFFPLHNYRTGFIDGNHLGSAMMLIETPSRTPFYLNLHAQGPKDNPSPGHTTLIGGNGSGKTVMMCCFDAMLNRYGGRSYCFDRNRGMEIYIRSCSGQYLIFSPDHVDQIQLNPFALLDTADSRKFCKEWLVQLVKQEEEIEVDEDVVVQLEQCVHYAFEKLSPEHRYLSNVIQLLPVDFKRWHRLNRWLQGNDTRAAGEYAYLFDHPTDTLSWSDKMGFDLTHFLDHESSSVLTALMMVLMHRIELTLKSNNKLVSFFLDEAWQYLDNVYWQEKLKKWLPTLRKANCHVIFATQSPHSVVTSPIQHTILDNCATQIYFANPQAKRSDYIDGLNLTESEFIAVQDNEPQSRLFLIKQGHQSSAEAPI